MYSVLIYLLQMAIIYSKFIWTMLNHFISNEHFEPCLHRNQWSYILITSTSFFNTLMYHKPELKIMIIKTCNVFIFRYSLVFVPDNRIKLFHSKCVSCSTSFMWNTILKVMLTIHCSFQQIKIDDQTINLIKLIVKLWGHYSIIFPTVVLTALI